MADSRLYSGASRGVALLLGANAALSHAGEADIAPDVLDELESTICISASNWTNSLEEHAKRHSISVETLSGQTISDPALRYFRAELK